MNILDIPTFSRRLSAAGYRLAGEAVPAGVAAALERGDGENALDFDFSLPGSTHGLRVSDPVGFAAAHRAGAGLEGGGALEFRFERLTREMNGKLFFKPFYRREDFDDERYSPVFSPIARPGQTVKIRFRLERWEGQSIGVEGYIRDTFSKAELIATQTIFPEEGKAYWLEFAIPDLSGSAADEVGLKLTSYSGKGKRDSGRLLVDRFSINGKARYAIDMSKQTMEFGCVTPFSHDGGTWSLDAGKLQVMTPVRAASYTGGYKVGDQRISAKVRPLAGRSHALIVRAGGAMRGYFGGFDQGGLSIFKNDFGSTLLAHTDYAWLLDAEYELSLEAIGGRITLCIDGLRVLEASDDAFATGMVGCGSLGAARALYGPFKVEEL